MRASFNRMMLWRAGGLGQNGRQDWALIEHDARQAGLFGIEDFGVQAHVEI